MAPSSLQHRRTHSLLLISKLLNQRDGSSPFTLVLDNLEQSGKPLMTEYIKRAALSNIRVVLVAFETLRKPSHVDVLIEGWKESMGIWQKEVVEQLRLQPARKTLLVFDCLNSLTTVESVSLPALLSSFIGPTTSLLALCHADIPAFHDHDNYSPPPLTLLRYLATTIFTTHSIHHVLARKAARDRSHAEPSFGLEHGTEGVLQSLGANGTKGLVLDMEHRRKSGRGVREWYFLPRQPLKGTTAAAMQKTRERVILLEDHPDYRTQEESVTAQDGVDAESTFVLGLTEKQRRDREGVVLPYFDAQKGGGDGGRILYDMGEEDDFDEEEDEI